MTLTTDILIDAPEEYDINMCKGVCRSTTRTQIVSSHVPHDNFIDWEDNCSKKKNCALEKVSTFCL